MGKLKKILKKVGKAALVGGLGYAAMKGLGKKKGTPSTNAAAIKAMTSNDAYNDDSMPMNLSKDMGMKRRRRDSILASPEINRMTDYYGEGLKKGGRVKGCGKALRGFGNAMKKGKK